MIERTTLILVAMLVSGCAKSDPVGEQRPSETTDSATSAESGTVPGEETHTVLSIADAASRKEAVAAIKSSGGRFKGMNLTLRFSPSNTSDADLECLEWFHDLERLKLNGTDISDAGLVFLKGVARVRELDLSDTLVTDHGLEDLLVLQSLSSLNLSGTEITDAGLKHIEKLSRLSVLRLSGTQVTDAGVERLHCLSRLRQLHLFSTSVTPECIEKLQLALPDCIIN